MAIYVIDSWPILEWLLDKAPVAALFEEFVDHSVASGDRLVMSRMNYGEVIYSLSKPKSHPFAERLLAGIGSLPIEVLTVDDLLVDEAAALKSRFAISYADCFAAALAVRLNASVVTGDKEFLALRDVGILQVEWLGA